MTTAPRNTEAGEGGLRFTLNPARMRLVQENMQNLTQTPKPSKCRDCEGACDGDLPWCRACRRSFMLQLAARRPSSAVIDMQAGRVIPAPPSPRRPKGLGRVALQFDRNGVLILGDPTTQG